MKNVGGRKYGHMRIVVVGMGYVGLTTAITLAYIGHDVVGIDVDDRKIERLKRRESPFYEPYLRELLEVVHHKLAFTTSYADAIPSADIVYIAVGTPSLPDGRPDLQYVEQAAREIGTHLGDAFTVVINKSTVPIGSGNWVEALIRESFRLARKEYPNGRFAIASNPEFLREGSALHNSLYPDRIVVGSENARAIEILEELYRPIVRQTFLPPVWLPRPEGLSEVPFLMTDLASAELIKYAANAFLAIKISFINEVSQLSEKVGADITKIARGIGLDARIGHQFLQAGIGWGGSCFPKDTAALIATAREYGLHLPIVSAARDINFRQRYRVVERLLQELRILKGKTIGLLGLSFKPNTDDLRNAPAYDIARDLIDRGAFVRACDPVALDRAKAEWDLDICYCDSLEALAEESDALVLVTEWKQFLEADWEALGKLMREPLLLDGRNALNREQMMKAGFRYFGVGVPPVIPDTVKVVEV